LKSCWHVGRPRAKCIDEHSFTDDRVIRGRVDIDAVGSEVCRAAFASKQPANVHSGVAARERGGELGPSKDKRDARDLLVKSSVAAQLERLFADAGYDAEWVHEFCREDWQVESFVKPVIHRADYRVHGHHRSQMTEEALKTNGDGRRWMVESILSRLKRTTRLARSARGEHALFIEASLRVLAYAVRC
jgi:hypothetical protein